MSALEQVVRPFGPPARPFILPSSGSPKPNIVQEYGKNGSAASAGAAGSTTLSFSYSMSVHATAYNKKWPKETKQGLTEG